MKTMKTKLEEIGNSFVSLSENMTEMHPDDVICTIGANKSRIEILLKLLQDEKLISEALTILSKNGKVKYDELNPIARATWDAYLRGFKKSIEIINDNDSI